MAYVVDDLGLVRDHTLVGPGKRSPMFNAEYRGLDIDECVAKWNNLYKGVDKPEPPTHPPPPPIPTFPVSLQADQLRLWQAVIVSVLISVVPPLDRHILWIYEEIGGFGKSVLSQHLVRSRGMLLLGPGENRDVLHGVVADYDRRGMGARIVGFDFSRSQDLNAIPWTAIEDVKDGEIFSTKFEPRKISFNRPHVIVFSNSAVPQPSPGKDAPCSLDRFVQVHARDFHEYLGTMAQTPSTIAELRTLPLSSGVQTFGELPT
jgi:hypothetical protein